MALICAANNMLKLRQTDGLRGQTRARGPVHPTDTPFGAHEADSCDSSERSIVEISVRHQSSRRRESVAPCGGDPQNGTPRLPEHKRHGLAAGGDPSSPA